MKKISHSKKPFAKRRTRIDTLDKKIIALLAQRIQLVREIAQEKKRLRLKIRQPQRMVTLLKERKEIAHQYALNPGFILRIYKLILAESMHIQEKELKKEI